MEIRNHTTNMVLHPLLQECLQLVRNERGFVVEEVVEQKINLLNDYYRQAGLKSAVVAVSGGIDSAVVLGLVEMAMRADDSPIENIVAVTMPALDSEGVTGQYLAMEDAHDVCDAFGVQPITFYMDPVVEAIRHAVEDVFPESMGDKTKWARGQAVSYARTPTYYYLTSVLAAHGKPGLVIGTTNLSEGGYLGYFGKASDGMVDLQLISDLFKDEVYQVGAFLGVPERIMHRAPTGDMFDATTDEVVFGAPYDFVELFTHMKLNSFCAGMVDEILFDNKEAQAQLSEYVENLERMHTYNAHKYLGRSPAVHLDVLPCGVKGGWDNPAWVA
jgi:NAD+ synthetase